MNNVSTCRLSRTSHVINGGHPYENIRIGPYIVVVVQARGGRMPDVGPGPVFHGILHLGPAEVVFHAGHIGNLAVKYHGTFKVDDAHTDIQVGTQGRQRVDDPEILFLIERLVLVKPVAQLGQVVQRDLEIGSAEISFPFKTGRSVPAP
jgi:hypothetical protein